MLFTLDNALYAMHLVDEVRKQIRCFRPHKTTRNNRSNAELSPPNVSLVFLVYAHSFNSLVTQDNREAKTRGLHKPRGQSFSEHVQPLFNPQDPECTEHAV